MKCSDHIYYMQYREVYSRFSSLPRNLVGLSVTNQTDNTNECKGENEPFVLIVIHMSLAGITGGLLSRRLSVMPMKSA